MPEFDQTFSHSIDSDFDDNHFECNSPSIVTILHFNDCYNVEPRDEEPRGGAPRLCQAFTQFRQFSHCRPLVLFSGDIMSPSIMSTFTRGEQMVPVLNALAIDCAVFGNHEFDFGVNHLHSFAKRTAFPWLLSNVYDSATERPIAGAKDWHIVDRNGVKFGIIGLAEEQWVVDALQGHGYTYRDFVAVGRKLAKELKEKESVNFVIALTHMRWNNDCVLARSDAPIDLILGGHDHDYDVRRINGKYCVKSGTDFRQFSQIEVKYFECGRSEVTVREVSVNSHDFAEDESLKRELKKYSTALESHMDVEVCRMGVELDGRFASIRSRETNLGDLVCDIALVSSRDVDAVLFNAGMFRSDEMHRKGQFLFRDLVRILPIMDELVVLRVTGRQLWTALEAGIARWPTLDGSFAHVSRIRFSFDPHKEVGARIDPKAITVGSEALDLDKEYRLLTEEFLHKGKDGYAVLKTCAVLVPKEHCLDVFSLVKNFMQNTDQKRDSKSEEYVKLEHSLRAFVPTIDERIVCLK